MTTPLDKAIAAADQRGDGQSGIARIAQACGTSRQFIHKMRRVWRDTGLPPKALRAHAPVIEAACGGLVTAEDLCPDVDWRRDAEGRITHCVVSVAPASLARVG